MSRFRRKNALAKLYAALTPCKEPELIAEAVIIEAMLKNKNICLLLKSLGLHMDTEVVDKKLKDKAVARELMEGIVAGGRNLNAIRSIAVDHAVLVVEKLELSVDRRGDRQRLMDAIRYWQQGVTRIDCLNISPSSELCLKPY